MSKYKVKVSQWRIVEACADTPEHQELVREWVDVVEAETAEDAKTKVFDGHAYICQNSDAYEDVNVETLGEADPSKAVTFFADWAGQEHKMHDPHEVAEMGNSNEQ